MFRSRGILVVGVALVLGWMAYSFAQDAPPAAQKFEIQRARYEAVDGAGGADVTDKVKALVQDGKLSIMVTNQALGGDPVPMHSKRLVVEYTLDGKPVTITTREGNALEIPPPPPLTSAQQREKALATLKSDAQRYDKAEALRQLTIIGDKESIPLVAGFLTNEELSHMARYALEPIPDAAVDDAFREALGKAKGNLLIGVINSIGVRRDAKSIEPLTKLLHDPEGNVASAAAIALGKIGTPESAKAIDQALGDAPDAVKPAFYDASLRCAEALASAGRGDEAITIYDRLRSSQASIPIRMGALRGAILARQSGGTPLLLEQLHGSDPYGFIVALRVVLELPGADVTQALTAELGKLPADKQSQLIQALSKRADKAALPALMAAAKSGEKEVRLAAIRALPEMGDPSAASVLVESTSDADGEIASAARESLGSLTGKEVDAVVIGMLEGADTGRRLTAIELVGRRRMLGAMALLLKAADDANQEIRQAALKTLGQLGGADEVSPLLDRLMAAKDPKDRDAIEKALSSAAARDEDADACAEKIAGRMAEATPEQKVALLPVLTAVGGPKALQAVRAAVDDPNADVHATAIRALGKWKTADAADALFELAKSSTNPTDKLLCLRSYIGLAGNRKMAEDQRLTICKKAEALIERNEEKKFLLGVLGGIDAPEALAMVMPYLDSPATKEEAGAAVLSVADRLVRDRKNGTKNAPKVLEPLEKVKKTTANADLAKRADLVLQQAQSKVPKKK